jgi:hypothetical protein
MNGLSAKDLKGDARRKWAEQRRKIYRRVLLSPSSSPEQKAAAKKKLAELR